LTIPKIFNFEVPRFICMLVAVSKIYVCLVFFPKKKCMLKFLFNEAGDYTPPFFLGGKRE